MIALPPSHFIFIENAVLLSHDLTFGSLTPNVNEPPVLKHKTYFTSVYPGYMHHGFHFSLNLWDQGHCLHFLFFS